VVSGERNLREASQHPNEALIHFGSPENTMSTSHDGRILDHLAGYMLYLSTAPSFWFSLNSSHGHGFHLSKRFGMIPHDYECIMIAANLAEHHRDKRQRDNQPDKRRETHVGVNNSPLLSFSPKIDVLDKLLSLPSTFFSCRFITSS
jgi:hypothetical protein